MDLKIYGWRERDAEIHKGKETYIQREGEGGWESKKVRYREQDREQDRGTETEKDRHK